MDIFEQIREKTMEKDAPLAARMRPETIEDVVGQEQIVGKGKLLYRAIKADQLGSIIFYGPPGTGKTTLARVIANTTKSDFLQLNATVAGKKEIQEVIRQAKDSKGMYGRKTILFVDEIHRFNKAQQDTLLPYVEDGTLTLVGATTENPYFEVNKALVSRSRIFQLRHLEKEDIRKLMERALASPKGLESYRMEVAPEALDFLADVAGGDARAALNAIELAAMTTDPDESGIRRVDLAVAQECIQKRALQYDKDGDNHYDVISAFIKSMRGSDKDAAVYYLARMLYAGEDPKFIARRIVICAAEDVGNADPRALQLAVAAAQAVDFIGMPEGRIILSQAVAYVACAPKSNAAYLAVDQALADVRDVQVMGVPPHLKDAHYKGAKDLGNGIGYKYAHDYPRHHVRQQYLPDELAGREYYRLTDQGYERKLKEWLRTLVPSDEKE
ncbi:replication-associated recombination protein A [Anaerotalea alkaliphila]|uniref:Replication-associated recombination protein A n=1 Tax=Anaerotalea alkaliphila TaxID=2662126 RepID=A0A7X5KNY4_9FIRM|nr:replication-associated recombination protein A [Anaerotalea alkaliphila]NDL68429.1 replication-associated recombination protein A [Anaerotalea alkaliphila]